MFYWMVVDIHCPEILLSPGKFASHAPNVGWKEEDSWNFTITEMIAYVGCGYYKEHIIPAFRRVAPFPRTLPFHFHSHLPINAVQFTILSIIAIGYKPVVAPNESEVSSILLPISKTATIDKTLFYEICIFGRVKFTFLPWTCIFSINHQLPEFSIIIS